MDTRYINIGTMPDGSYGPLIAGSQAVPPPVGNSTATLVLQKDERGNLTGLLSFAGGIKACLNLEPNGNKVIAYTLIGENYDPNLWKSVENLAKALPYFISAVN